jgi:hypothetical protein
MVKNGNKWQEHRAFESVLGEVGVEFPVNRVGGCLSVVMWVVVLEDVVVGVGPKAVVLPFALAPAHWSTKAILSVCKLIIADEELRRRSSITITTLQQVTHCSLACQTYFLRAGLSAKCTETSL